MNYIDPTGHFWKEIAGFFREFVSAVTGMRGQLATAAGVSQLDSPLPGPADVVAGVLAVGVLVKATIDAAKAAANAVNAKKINVSDVAQSVSAAVPHAVAESIEDSRQPTYIYRYGGTNPGNLVPTDRDVMLNSGLSFSTIPRNGAAMTTIEEINSTGILFAVQDSATHVSVYPADGTIEDWHRIGVKSKWTLLLKLLVRKYRGL